MESSKSVAVPPGFRFHPTDEELVGYYLKKKIASQKIDLDVIPDIDLYRIEPWDLQDRCGMGYEEQKDWYFFSHKDKKYPTGTRTNRATMAGFWKATGRDKAVYDKATKLIGMRKTLVFYKGRAPNGQKTDWIMHEYRLESEHENAPPQEEGWVVCRAFKKKTSTQSKTTEGWDSSYIYDEPSGVCSVIDPIYARRQPQTSGLLAKNLHCKQEIESEIALARFMHHSSSMDQSFLNLPQLESPNSQLSLLKRVSIFKNNVINNSSSSNNNNISYDQDNNIYGNMGDNVTNWRALDKFVASQLSQDPELVGVGLGDHNQGISSFYNNHVQESSTTNSDIEALLLLHGINNGRELEEEIIEGNKLISSFLSSCSGENDNIGIIHI